MAVIQKLLISIVALIHLVFLWVEMFRWEERGPEIFPAFPPEFFPQTSAMAANQGLYNGFIAVGLIWSVIKSRQEISRLFLCFVVVAGVYGGMTVDMKILYLQAAPAVLALLVMGARLPASISQES
ncbi:DUF1304 domain-containing protein [Sedimentitalea todarodis]|uniref:DUF1304 domain-containing protein n=1 Tax=Sedimentitalea todarodis TaxID=1631240 RepID=A0ABU3VLB4_9RHOB|nr:DUF1304 domain-containing protein [Sedimentitalea todarodis]MDU9006979.1 DUF1304 domain-containing protein [Sedimentitalea todarodis]